MSESVLVVVAKRDYDRLITTAERVAAVKRFLKASEGFARVKDIAALLDIEQGGAKNDVDG